jgi:peptide/nickel transport system permease protein
MSPRRYLGSAWRHPIARAVLKAVFTIWVATSLTFFLIRLMPGSPVEIKIDELITQSNGAITYDEAAVIASSLFAIDLNAPMHEQYLSYLGNVLRGDLGQSFLSTGTPVMAIILSVLPWTLFAVGTGLMLSFVVGIGLGLVAAYRRNSLFDHVVSSAASIVSSVPNYLIALLIVLILGVQLGVIPIAAMRGAYTPGVEVGFNLTFILDVFFHAALPISVFFLTHLGHWILSMRSATLAALEEDYVTAARARGLSDGRITTAYVGRNAVLPLVTQFAIATGFVVGGAVIIERIFVYQGVGLRLLNSVFQRDYPVLQGIVLLTTVAVVVANLIADLLYTRLDPRIGRAGGATG